MINKDIYFDEPDFESHMTFLIEEASLIVELDPFEALKLFNDAYKLYDENYKHSKTRVRVEHIFGTLTSQMNNALNLTSIGIDRIKSTIGLTNLTYNLVRYEQMVRLQKVKLI